MNAQQIMDSESFKRCAAFHGHVCGGLAIGYVAATAGLNWLREQRALDEELVAIVETDACCVDAIQVVTGCTFGKGNLIYRDYIDRRAEDLFAITPVTVGMPNKARIESSTLCSRCGEPTMASKLATVDGSSVRRGCLA